MKILFVITGFGYGDSMRMETLINELKKKKKHTSIMILGYEHSYNYFNKKYQTLKIKGYNFPDRKLHFRSVPFIFKNLLLPKKWYATWTEHKEKLQNYNPDVIVSDFEPVAILLGKKLKKPVVSIFAYDPQLFKKYPYKNTALRLQAKYLQMIYNLSNHVVIPSFLTKKNHGKYQYIPPLLKKSSTELADETTLLKKLKLKKKPILVMLGGSNYGVQLAQRIKENLPRFRDEFIFFGSRKSIAAHHYKFKNNFLEYLKVSKALITLSGNLTLTEGLAYKKPLLVFPIKNHVEQTLNAYALDDYIMQGDSTHPERSIAIFLKNLESYQKKVNEYSFNHNGAKILAEYLLKNYS